MANIVKLRNDLVSWNNLFPLDRLYRQRNNILYNSAAHREVCQIDIYLDWLEAELFKEYEADFIESEKRVDLYKKGIWLQEREDKDMSDEDFDNIVIN